MGRTRVLEMVEFIGYDAAIIDHLQHNLFPPVPSTWAPVAKEAISSVRDGNPKEPVKLVGLIPANGCASTAAAESIVEALRLEPFLEVTE